MTEPRILVIDDERGRLESWVRTLRLLPPLSGAEVVPLADEALLNSLAVLEERRLGAREQPGGGFEPPTEFDAADILVVDYDLVSLTGTGSLTGEAIAYLARAYSRVGFIVVLNENGESTFDLTLRGDPDSFADLILGSRHLDASGLWSPDWHGFRPWSWPQIAEAAFDQRELIAEVLDNLDTPVLHHLGLDASPLAREVRSFLDVPGAGEEATFREFVVGAAGGLRRKDLPLNEEATARVAIARIRRWLEYDVLSAQDLLVDAPHLVSRYPSLLTSPQDDLNGVTQVAAAHRPPPGIEAGDIEKHLYPRTQWMTRSVWYWHSLIRDMEIREVREPWAAEVLPFRFCEDISRFLPASATREFVASVAGAFARRYIVDPWSDEGAVYRDVVGEVQYRPSARLASQ